MDKASDFGSEDCEFESRRGRILFSPHCDLYHESDGYVTPPILGAYEVFNEHEIPEHIISVSICVITNLKLATTTRLELAIF